MTHINPKDTIPSLEEEIARSEHRRHIRNIILLCLIVPVAIGVYFLYDYGKSKKGQVHYPALSDSIRVVYIANEPNPDLALRKMQATMQTTAPRFSAIIFSTSSPELFPTADKVDPSIPYLAAPNDSAAVAKAIEFAQNAGWGTAHRYLYHNLTTTGKIDTLMDIAIRKNIFTGRARVALAETK